MTKPKHTKPRKNYGLRLEKDLMLELQHLALDVDQYINELLEEAMRDLLKKYRDKRKA